MLRAELEFLSMTSERKRVDAEYLVEEMFQEFRGRLCSRTTVMGNEVNKITAVYIEYNNLYFL